MFDFAQQEGKGREGKGIGGRTCVMLSGCEEPGEDLRVAARPAVGDSGREWRRRRKEKGKSIGGKKKGRTRRRPGPKAAHERAERRVLSCSFSPSPFVRFNQGVNDRPACG